MFPGVTGKKNGGCHKFRSYSDLASQRFRSQLQSNFLDGRLLLQELQKKLRLLAGSPSLPGDLQPVGQTSTPIVKKNQRISGTATRGWPSPSYTFFSFKVQSLTCGCCSIFPGVSGALWRHVAALRWDWKALVTIRPQTLLALSIKPASFKYSCFNLATMAVLALSGNSGSGHTASVHCIWVKREVC